MGTRPDSRLPLVNTILCHAVRMGDGGWDAKNSEINTHWMKVLNFVKELTNQTF